MGFSRSRQSGFGRASQAGLAAQGSELGWAAGLGFNTARVCLEGVARRLLGLTLDPGPFERELAQDARVGPLIAQRRGLRIAQTATPFEALTWAVMGQQVNLSFALALRRTFIAEAGCRHGSGMWCYPGPAEVARIDPERLCLQKFSRAKAEAVVRIAREVVEGRLDLEERAGLEERLLALKGVGPWTAQYTQLRGYGHGDCSLHGDSAVRKAMQRVFGRELGAPEAERLLHHYRPYRSLAAAHFWASLAP